MSLIIYAVTCSPVQSKINVAAARKYRRHRCETQLYTSFAVAPVTSTKNQYFPPTWNILSAVSDEFSISILSTRLITVTKKEKKGGRELKNIQSLSSRRFVRGDTWLCKYFHFKRCQGQRSSFTSRIIGCTPGDVYRILKYVWERTQPVFLVRISLARVTPPRGLSSWGTGNPVFHSITDQLLKSCWESFYGTERTMLTRVICLTSNSDSLPVWIPCDFGLEGRSMIRSAR